jgi:hypothetical protein
MTSWDAAAARRHDQGHGANPKQERGHADERRQQPPDDEQDAKEVEVGGQSLEELRAKD